MNAMKCTYCECESFSYVESNNKFLIVCQSCGGGRFITLAGPYWFKEMTTNSEEERIRK